MSVYSKSESPLFFDRIAQRYDGLNRLLSLGVDIKWRQFLIGKLLIRKPKMKVLDLATGTGDVAEMLLKTYPNKLHVTGMDMSKGMLDVGRIKLAKFIQANQAELSTGDIMNLPLGSGSMDAVIIAFGIRNVQDTAKGLSEIFRVLVPEGQVLILEFSIPSYRLLKWAYLFYLRTAMPWIGGIFSGDAKAYRYLNQTIETFPSGAAFIDLLKATGFESARHYPLTFGSVTVYEAFKPK